MENQDVLSWTCKDVGDWLKENGFEKYAGEFSVHKIDGLVLLMMDEADLRQPPLQLEILGDVKKLFSCIQKLKRGHYNGRDHSLSTHYDSVDGTSLNSACCSSHHRPAVQRMLSSDTGTDDETIDKEIERIASKNGSYTQNSDPEIFKTLLSFIYVFVVFLLTAFIMTVVHDRVPDPQKYPPLPDIFLDNMPYVPWAFEVCEMIGVVMFSIWAIILFFHKHRFILMRRMFSMLGTTFLLRCVTMLITSLSVPGIHLQCGQKFGTWYSKMTRTFEIWSGFGMSIQGVKSCGDYMFSGHTSCITLLNFFITEYTSRRLYQLHTFTWVANLFAIFFLLAAHEHYSIDVFIAFYITSRLFLYYHTLANNRSLMARDKYRRRIWFPLFSYFESKCDGIVPNTYEWPFPYPKSCVHYFEKKQKRH
ncbi:sphingomyelin synthase-related protein 1-like [Dreissena polymorpha]|uniref:SAM domain-containing protein n=1 Tax=Dreissena polymorpha TaxID=45954 RepID=A0A9D4DFA1_DREPO|nr:sphingomyelin synthase-related protein 1-like [Dreissena polymorpha]XP_052235442.1 sphingomyelin synthase-related protein 1-like [Dreissena polymorpha]XP_052235443.1 sphingomyelin synthase-related protein 1-like [Dreissena polymorpha]KAH3747465.1 hypothetical protein DPMN_181892 [Dreissena polymorpha]